MKKKILLLNPPSLQKTKYLRDFYCSHISKANYYWQPYDLLVLSGILFENGYEFFVLDATVENLKFDAAKKRIVSLSPDIIIFVTGTVSFSNDATFLGELKNIFPDTLFFGSGDILYHLPEESLSKNQWLDGILMDFTSPEIVLLVEEPSVQNLKTIITRENFIGTSGDNKSIPARRLKPATPENFLFDLFGLQHENRKYFEIPVPRHEKFPLNLYSLPHTKHKLFTSLSTSFACPFRCSFCHILSIPFKARILENVLLELKHINSLNIREIWFRDFTFSFDRERTIKLCEKIKKNFKFDWITVTRVDCVDKELLQIMKSAGCHTIQFGVETANEDILMKYRKPISNNEVREIFSICKKLKIRILAHFMIGFPEEDKYSILDTIKFAKEINPDYASFNVPSPFLGTELRKKVLENNLIDPMLSYDLLDNSLPVIKTEKLNPEIMENLLKKAIREFYFRPKYLITMLKRVSTIYQLKILINEFFYFLFSFVYKSKIANHKS